MTLILILLLTTVIHGAETSSYSIRLGGIRLRKIAVALSLTGIVLLISRTSNLFQAPMLGGIVDQAKQQGSSTDVLHVFRLVLLAASVGTLLSIVLYPTFTRLATKVITRFEVEGSIVGLMKVSNIQKLTRTRTYVRAPKISMIKRLRVGGVPKRLMLTNMVITSIYTTGVLAALYASVLDPAHATTSSMASGVVNGAATILLTLFLDPHIALMTERALNEPQGADSMSKAYGWLMISRFFGTLLAQAILIPAAHWISWVSGFLS